MDKQEVATEIRGRWKDMPEADVTRVIDAIWQHANHQQIELTRCYTRSTSVNVTGRSTTSQQWPTDDQVIAYVHGGHVDLFDGPNRYHRITLTNYRGGYTRSPSRHVRHR